MYDPISAGQGWANRNVVRGKGQFEAKGLWTLIVVANRILIDLDFVRAEGQVAARAVSALIAEASEMLSDSDPVKAKGLVGARLFVALTVVETNAL